MPRPATPNSLPFLTAVRRWFRQCAAVCHWLRQCVAMLPPARRRQYAYSFASRAKPAPRRGFTLVEVLVSISLALVLLAAVTVVFGRVGGSINNVRAALEQFDRLRAAEQRLRMDLDGATAVPIPPLRPESMQGYFEYLEKGWLATPWDTSAGTPDWTVNQHNDVLMFTTHTKGMPFVGRFGNATTQTTIQSDTAEVAWFVRGRTLHRRILLVVPGLSLSSAGSPFYAYNDISYRTSGGSLIANTLGDLTKRENRFAHPNDAFPYDAGRWGQYGLPTLREHSSVTTLTCPATPPNPITREDLWSTTSGTTSWLADNALAADAGTTRMVDDVILTNVIGFDVKAWDPTQQNYVDLGYNGTTEACTQVTSAAIRTNPTLLAGLTHRGHPRSYLVGSGTDVYGYPQPRTYDTYTTHYETDPSAAIPANPGFTPGKAANGFDDMSGTQYDQGIVDSIVYNPASLINSVPSTSDLMQYGENQTAPPYPVPLRGIQIKVRIFEPDSREIREITITQDFLPK
jgi:prepilin-type N-terminal cleavage/methylation domain-containing protein